jgi:hypothetical protein
MKALNIFRLNLMVISPLLPTFKAGVSTFGFNRLGIPPSSGFYLSKGGMRTSPYKNFCFLRVKGTCCEDAGAGGAAARRQPQAEPNPH